MKRSIVCTLLCSWLFAAGPASADLTYQGFFWVQHPGLPNGMGFNEFNDQIYVHELNSANCDRYDRSGTYLGSFVCPGAHGPDTDYSFAPEPLIIGGVSVPAGSLLVFEGQGNRLIAANPNNGSTLVTLNVVGVSGTFMGGSYNTHTGTFFAAAWGFGFANIIEFDSSGTVLNTSPAVGLSDVGDLEVNQNTGNIWVLMDSFVIHVYDASGTFIENVNFAPLGGASCLGFDHTRNEVWIGSTTQRVNRYSGLTLPPILGDVNLDGEVNLLDVNHFIDRVASGEYQVEADANEDGAVNLLDVDFFIALLGN